MRYMMIVKSTPDSEKGALPTTEELTAMGKYNEELVKAGVMLDGNGLAPSSQGARVTFASEGKTTVTDGPFAESKELIAGYWILDVKSREEAIEWARRVPFGSGGVLEIRKVAEAEDFGDNFTPELRETEEALNEEVAKRRQG
ncbi:YciI family protein [Saccharomonospora sp. NPDC006951]